MPPRHHPPPPKHPHPRGSRGEVPEAQGAVPGTRERKLPVGGDDHVADEVRVTAQSSLGDPVVGLVAGQLPHDDGFIWEGGKQGDEVGEGGGCHLRDAALSPARPSHPWE